MSTCCTTAGAASSAPNTLPVSAPERCPRCGTKGKKVERLTLMALLRPEARGRIADAAHRICLAAACDVVYFGVSDRFTRDDVNVRVGEKETAPDRLVCYCFDHTPAKIEEEIRETGRTTLADRITAEVAAGRCACEVTNPQGTCCLGNVGRAVKEATERANAAPAAPTR